MADSPDTADRDRRFPRAVYGRGGEPDPRFSLANERTFLAWVRTSLALLAGGVALEAFEVPLHPTARAIAAGAALALGLAAAVQAWLGWTRTERALREGRPLPSPVVAPMLVAGLALATLGVVVGLLL